MDDSEIIALFPEAEKSLITKLDAEAWGKPDDNPPFLSRDFILHYLPMIGASLDLLPYIDHTLSLLEKMPVMRRFAAGVSNYQFHNGRPMGGPVPLKPLGEYTGIFNLLVAMSAIPYIENTYAQMGIPQRYAENTARWLGGTIPIYQAAHDGFPGHDARQSPWLSFAIAGRLFRIGRFEYLLQSAPDWLPALFKNRHTGKIVALCREGWRIDQDGWRCCNEDTSARRTHLSCLPDRICGTPVNLQTGRAESGRTVSLSPEEYRDWLNTNELVPTIHIPGGEPLTAESALASFRAAPEFFARYLHQKLRACCCSSWILNPAWQTELPASNLAAFQKLCCLSPALPEPKAGLFFVYGRDDGDFRDYPVKTALHKAFRHQFESGQPFRCGAMFLDLENL